MGFIDLIGYDLVLDGRQWVGTLTFADMNLGDSIQTQPYWLAGVVGGSPDAIPLVGMNPWGMGEWSVDCWFADAEMKCGFAVRENDTFNDTDLVVDPDLEGNTLSFTFPYGYPRLGDTFGVYAQTDSGYDYYGVDDTGLLLDVDLQCPYPGDMVGMVLDGVYNVCGSGCTLRDNIVEGQKEVVWCMHDNACVAKGCDCHLFSSDLNDPPQDPDSWRHEAEPAEKIQKDNNRAYHCFCVK
jgi:hypothetical protein